MDTFNYSGIYEARFCCVSKVILLFVVILFRLTFVWDFILVGIQNSRINPKFNENLIINKIAMVSQKPRSEINQNFYPQPTNMKLILIYSS